MIFVLYFATREEQDNAYFPTDDKKVWTTSLRDPVLQPLEQHPSLRWAKRIILKNDTEDSDIALVSWLDDPSLSNCIIDAVRTNVFVTENNMCMVLNKRKLYKFPLETSKNSKYTFAMEPVKIPSAGKSATYSVAWCKHRGELWLVDAYHNVLCYTPTEKDVLRQWKFGKLRA